MQRKQKNYSFVTHKVEVWVRKSITSSEHFGKWKKKSPSSSTCSNEWKLLQTENIWSKAEREYLLRSTKMTFNSKEKLVDERKDYCHYFSDNSKQFKKCLVTIGCLTSSKEKKTFEATWRCCALFWGLYFYSFNFTCLMSSFHCLSN